MITIRHGKKILLLKFYTWHYLHDLARKTKIGFLNCDVYYMYFSKLLRNVSNKIELSRTLNYNYFFNIPFYSKFDLIKKNNHEVHRVMNIFG